MEIAQCLKLTKGQLVQLSPPGELHQSGAESLGIGPDLPPLASLVKSAIPGATSEPLIDLFVVDAERSCTPTGSNAELNGWWRQSVELFAAQVLDALAAEDVKLAGPAYVTASLTPMGLIEGQPHFDDDLYAPDVGVGVVAIVGDIAGPRVAAAPVPVEIPIPGASLLLGPQVMADFDGGGIVHHQADPMTAVMFPQFGQLHAGPRLAGRADQTAVRRLLVFRAATRPAD